MSADPEVKNFLTYTYDRVFLQKLKLAQSSDENAYVNAQLANYSGASAIHKAILGIIHSNGLLILSGILFQLF